MRAKSLQSCLTLWDVMDCSPSGSSVLGILQAVKFWSGLSCPPSEDILDTWIKITSTCGSFIARRFFTSEPLGKIMYTFSSVQFSSVAQSCPTLFDSMNCSTPGLPVHHQLLEFTQTHVHRVSDAIQPSHPLSLPCPPDPNPPQHRGLFQWVNSPHEVAKVLEFQLEHQSFQWTPWTGLLQNGLVGSPCSSKGLSRAFSNTTVQKHQFFDTQLSSQSNSHIHTWPQEKP